MAQVYLAAGAASLHPLSLSHSTRVSVTGWDNSGLRKSLTLRPAQQISQIPPSVPSRSKSGTVSVRARLLDVNKVDEKKFSALVAKRVVYSHDEWKKHKSSGRYLRHMSTTLRSEAITAIGPIVFFMSGIAAGVVGWNELILLQVLPDSFPLLHMPSLPFTLVAPALSFLLVFRTNASYGRFDEARKMWGLMLNRSRDICRQALSYMARDEYAYEYPKRAQFLRHLQAFPLTYKHHFLQEGTLEDDLRTFTKLTDDEVEAILKATHRPNYTLQMMSECMRACSMEPIHRNNMDTNLTTFADDIGGSERLFKTPIPLSYTRLTSRLIFVFHAFLPLGLWDACGWLTIPVEIMSATIFFCIEEVGVLIENPFPILALDVIAQSARNNVAELNSLHEGIMARVAADDEDVKQAMMKGDIKPADFCIPESPNEYKPEPALQFFVDKEGGAEPEIDLSDDESNRVSVTSGGIYRDARVRGPYSDDFW